MATTIRIDPASKKVHLEFSWDDNGVAHVNVAGDESHAPAQQAVQHVEKVEEKKVEQKEYTLAEVAKHNTKADCWVSLFSRTI